MKNIGVVVSSAGLATVHYNAHQPIMGAGGIFRIWLLSSFSFSRLFAIFRMLFWSMKKQGCQFK